MDADEAIAKGEVDLANAVNLDDSESEEELEDIMDDFTAQDEDEVRNRRNHLVSEQWTLDSRASFFFAPCCDSLPGVHHLMPFIPPFHHSIIPSFSQPLQCFVSCPG
jgi:hypothetical protein